MQIGVHFQTWIKDFKILFEYISNFSKFFIAVRKRKRVDCLTVGYIQLSFYFTLSMNL